MRIKFRLGLFDRNDRSVADDPKALRDDALAVARQLAVESAVLLKNENGILPISTEIESLAVVGPLASAPYEQLGTWAFDGRRSDSITPVMALRHRLGEERILFAPGLQYSRDASRRRCRSSRSRS